VIWWTGQEQFDRDCHFRRVTNTGHEQLIIRGDSSLSVFFEALKEIVLEML